MGTLRIVSEAFDLFQDRQEAGRLLGWELHGWRRAGVVVLGFPGGGMLVAKELAEALDADLDVILSRKMRAPGDDGTALGVVTEGSDVIVSETAVERLRIPRSYLAVERELQEREMLRQSSRLRRVRPKLPLEDRTVILTDEAVTTGSSMQAAIWAVKQEKPRTVLVGIPVAAQEGIARLAREADTTVCLRSPQRFVSAGQFYVNYDTVDEGQTCEILEDLHVARTGYPGKRKKRRPASHILRAAFARCFM